MFSFETDLDYLYKFCCFRVLFDVVVDGELFVMKINVFYWLSVVKLTIDVPLTRKVVNSPCSERKLEYKGHWYYTGNKLNLGTERFAVEFA